MNIKIKGFTLVELLIVIAIIAILASIGYPAYNDQVQKTRRASAQADLIELASFMERWYGENFTYQTAASGVPTLPYTESPKDSGSKFYDLILVAADLSATTYTLRATPKNGQDTDTCSTLSLSHTGATTPMTNNCWP